MKLTYFKSQERLEKLQSEAEEQQRIASQSNTALASKIDEARAESNDLHKRLKAAENELQLGRKTVAILKEEKDALIDSLDVQKLDNVSLPGLENMDESWVNVYDIVCS